MGHFHNPPPGPIIGATAAQPNTGPLKLPPSKTAVPVNNPPFTQAERRPLNIDLAAWAAQPAPWQYIYPEVEGQPYSQKKLPPSITAVPVNNPPFVSEGRQVWEGVIVQVWQPDPWQYQEVGPAGGLQPYGQKKLPPSITAVPVNNPPFSNQGSDVSNLTAVQAWQPDPWQFNFLGPITGQQPYGARQLNPSITAVPVNNPPFSNQGSDVSNLTAVQTWQPDPWQYNYLGSDYGRQPYGSKQLPPSITAVPVNNPPFNQRVEPNEGLAAWQVPDPPIQLPRYYPQAPVVVVVTFVPFTNTWLSGVLTAWQPPDPQPTLQGKLNPSITAVPVNNPSPNADQLVTTIGIIQAWQPPDPQPFISYTGWQPLAPNKLSPGIPGQSADPPPFAYAGLNPQQQAITQLSQPDPWQYNYVGATYGLQPYGYRSLNPSITAVPVNNPPFTQRDSRPLILSAWVPPDPLPTLPTIKTVQPFVTPSGQPFIPTWLNSVLQAWQPDPWQYNEVGAVTGLQPYGARQLNPSITAVPVNNPPFNQRVEPLPGLSAWQVPDPPIQPPRYYPQPLVTYVPFTNTWLSGVLTAWQPPDPQPTLNNLLNPSITAVPVNNPPGKFYPAIIVVDDPPQPQQLGPFFANVFTQPVNNPPFGQTKFYTWAWGEPTISVQTGGATIQSVDNPPFNQRVEPLPGLTAWQPPPPSPFISNTGQQPLAQGKGFPQGVAVNNPPFSSATKLALNINILTTWEPPPPQPVQRGPLPPAALAVPVNNPPFTNRARIENFNTMLAAWEIPLPPQPQQTKYIVTVIPPPPPVKELHDHPFFTTFGKMSVH